MATKNDCLFSKDKQKSAPNGFCDSGDIDLNLNQNHKCRLLIPVQSFSNTTKDKFYGKTNCCSSLKQKTTFNLPDSTVSENYKGKDASNGWNKSPNLCSNNLKQSGGIKEKAEKQWKKDNSSLNKSTLSLHIATFENSVEAVAASNTIKKLGNEKEGFSASEFVIQNPFEFPRQQSDRMTEPEMSQFRASQQLLSPNEGTTKAPKTMFYHSASAQDNNLGIYNEGDDEEEENYEPNSQTIYHSSSAFEDYNLKPELIAACYSLGFQRPSRVQAFCLKSFDEGSPSLVIQSQNGTGKTLAFLLPIVQRINPCLKAPQCIIVVPTLELAQQTVKIARELCSKIPDIQIQEVSTMTNVYNKQVNEQIVIGSPGRMHNILLKNLLLLKYVKFLIFDEADVMFDMQGSIDIGTKIAYRITRDTPNVRTCFCSATYNERTNHVISILLPEFKALKIKTPQLSLDNIKQYVARCFDRAAKFQAILYMCSTCAVPSTVLFCNTRATADWIRNKMEENGRQTGVLHGGQSDEQRSEVVKKFKNSEFKVLISTNLISRGLDVPHVCMVVNYDLPTVHENGEPDYRTYLHRVGRCGRFGKVGIALNLVDSDKEYDTVMKFAEHFQHEIEELDFSNTEHLDQLMAFHGASS